MVAPLLPPGSGRRGCIASPNRSCGEREDPEPVLPASRTGPGLRSIASLFRGASMVDLARVQFVTRIPRSFSSTFPQPFL
jgi:hypothetical protein